jgi:hypothetical protein
MIKKILLVLLVILVIIQFIHPSRNKAEGAQPNYMGNKHAIPDDVKHILARACNDCHSNNTVYPWYSKIQPVDWWLNKHIRNGKKGLNFDEYTHRTARYQYHKMEETIEMVKEGEMPLKSYKWIHKDSRLTEEEKNTIISWAESVMTAMEARYPPDSLKARK